jgi:CheY-like chemotaxis protein/HPt (histidine-containing phosphotransfer) domain-containing protein
MLDVEQSSVAHTEPGDEPVPRLPDDHLNWLDKQTQGGIPHEVEVAEEAEVHPSHTRLVGRVLVVEDNPVNQAVVKKMLEKAGLSPVTANDGLQAMDVLREEQFDVVLMDCQMPRMDGYEATEAIREREARQGLARMPVIAMTANAMSGDRERCLAVGMDDYLSKPVKPSQLENMLRQWLPMEEVLAVEATDRMAPSMAPVVEFNRAEAVAGQTAMDTGVEIMESRGNIDRSVLKELYEIMEEDFVSVIQSYLKTAPGLMHGIRDAVRTGDMDALVKSAHPLKSSSANVGAMALSQLARELEFKGRERDSGGLVETYNRTAEAFRSSVGELREIVEQGRV